MSFTTIAANLPTLSVELDVTNDPTNPTRVWTDITTSVRQLRYTRSGRNDELQRTSPGTLTAVCDNRGDAVSGLGVRKAQWIRVRAQWSAVTYARWQGILTSVPRQWPHAGKDGLITLNATDVLKVFTLYDLAGQTFSAQRNDQRVAAIAALASVTAGSIDTDTDAADAITDPISEGTDALSMLLDIEQSENGLLIGEPDGTVSFQGRHWRMLNSASSSGTFGESVGQIPYTDDATYDDDDARIANIVSVTPTGGTAVVVEDATSQGDYFERRLNRTLETSSVSVATDAANFLLARYKDPSPRIPTLSVSLLAAKLKSAALVPVLLAAGNSDRFTWKRAAASPISDDVYVEQIAETVTPGSDWQMTFQLSPAADESGWVLGDSVLGVLGETTRLVY